MLEYLWHRFQKSTYEQAQSCDSLVKLHNFIFVWDEDMSSKDHIWLGLAFNPLRVRRWSRNIPAEKPKLHLVGLSQFNIFLIPQRSISYANMVIRVKGFYQCVVDINLHCSYDLFIEHLNYEALVCSPRILEFELYNFVSVDSFLGHVRFSWISGSIRIWL